MGKFDDANIFFTSLVLLQLISIDEINAKTEVDNIREQVEKLVLSEKIVDGKDISVSYPLALTMLDVKVCNAITGNSMQRFY